MIQPKTAAILLTSAVTATIVATCLLGLGVFGDGPRKAATALRAELPQPVVERLLDDEALDGMTILAMTTPVSGAAVCVANSVRVSERCNEQCDSRSWSRFEFECGVCGFATRCECPEIGSMPVAAAADSTKATLIKSS